MDERQLLETTLDHILADDLAEGEADRLRWPPVANRIRVARARVGATWETFAARLGQTPSSYWDLELYNDELFYIIPVNQLRSLAELLGLSVAELLFGNTTALPTTTTPFDEVAARLRGLLKSEGISVEELSERVGWELDNVLVTPESLADYSVDAFYEICKTAGVDWVKVLAHACAEAA